MKPLTPNTMKISYYNWFKTIQGLKKRGEGRRESGAFFLHRFGENKVCKIVFYDQFDKNVSNTGRIEFKGGNEFHKYLMDNDLSVFADIHSHPTDNTNQSESDKYNPMIRIKGHVAIIAPNFASNRFLLPKDCSIYQYQGERLWRQIMPNECLLKLSLL